MKNHDNRGGLRWSPDAFRPGSTTEAHEAWCELRFDSKGRVLNCNCALDERRRIAALEAALRAAKLLGEIHGGCAQPVGGGS